MRVLQTNPNRKKRRRKNGLALVALTVLILCGVIGVSGYSLLKERSALQQRYAELEQELTDEIARFDLLKERRAYMQTIRYIEETAREKLGLVYENEIIFIPKPEE